MKRREFVKILPLLAGVSLAAIPKRKEAKPRHLIALGSAATAIVMKYGAQLPFDSFTLINDKIPDGCALETDFIPFDSPGEAFEYFGDRRFLKKTKLPSLQLPHEIEAHLKSKSGELVFLAGLGKASGTMLMTAIVEQYHSALQNLRFVGTLPFDYEGSTLDTNALHVAEVMHSHSHQYSILPLQGIRVRFGNLSIRTAFEKADELVLNALKRLN